MSEHQVLPNLDANAAAVAIEHLRLENEGWERDTSVTEPELVLRLIPRAGTLRSQIEAQRLIVCY